MLYALRYAQAELGFYSYDIVHFFALAMPPEVVTLRYSTIKVFERCFDEGKIIEKNVLAGQSTL